MAERALTLSLDTKLRSGGDEGLRKIERAVKNLGASADRTFRDFNDAQEKAARATKALADALNGVGKAGSKSLSQLAADARKAGAELEAVRRKIQGAAAPSGLSRIGAGLRSVGGGAATAAHAISPYAAAAGLALPTSALAAFAASVSLADKAVRTMYGSIERGRLHGGAAEDKILQSLQEKAPVAGPMLERQSREQNKQFWSRRLWQGLVNPLAVGRMSDEWVTRDRMTKDRVFTEHGIRDWRTDYADDKALAHLSYDQRAYRLFLAKQSVGHESAVAGARMGAFGEESALRMRLVGQQAGQQAGRETTRSLYGISAAAAARQSAALLGIQGQTGYGRHEQAEDVFRRIGFQANLQQIGAEGMARMGALSMRQQEAAGREGDLQGKYHQATREHAALVRQLRTHEKNHGQGEEAYRLQMRISAAYEKQRAVAEQLQQAQKTSLELRVQGEQEVYNIQQKQHQAMQAQVSALNDAIQKEQQRKRDLTESLALMHPMKLRTAVGIQRKFQAGRNVTQREIEFMQGMPQLFGGQLQQIAARRAANNPLIQELMQTTGQDRRERELKEQKVALENHINIKLDIDERALASAWERQVMPAFLRVAQQIRQEMDNRINELENRRITEARRTFPQF